MSDIFISYSRKDIQLVSSLASALENQGYSVWWDVRGLHGGQAFSTVIRGEIDRAHCVIVVWSKASVASEWVHAEASYAKDRKPPILLTTVCQDTSIPLPFNTRHNEDLCNWNGNSDDPKFHKLLHAVTRYCRQPSNVQNKIDTESGNTLGSGDRVLRSTITVGIASSIIAATATMGAYTKQITLNL